MKAHFKGTAMQQYTMRKNLSEGKITCSVPNYWVNKIMSPSYKNSLNKQKRP